MEGSSSRSADEIEKMLRVHSDMLFRIALVMLGNKYDAEDVLQETVIRYMQKAPAFNSPEHEKACSFSIYSLSVYQKCRKCQRENTLWHKYYPAASGILNDRIAAHG